MNNLARIQQEQDVWRKENFPNQEPWENLLGAFEEVGELIVSLRKMTSRHVAISDSYSNWVMETQDAIGDICIFLLGFCNHYQLSIRDIKESSPPWKPYDAVSTPFWEAEMRMIPPLARLSHVYLKAHQGIRGRSLDNPESWQDDALTAISQIFVELNLLCTLNGWDLINVVESTWNSVKQRKWRTSGVG